MFMYGSRPDNNKRYRLVAYALYSCVYNVYVCVFTAIRVVQHKRAGIRAGMLVYIKLGRFERSYAG